VANLLSGWPGRTRALLVSVIALSTLVAGGLIVHAQLAHSSSRHPLSLAAAAAAQRHESAGLKTERTPTAIHDALFVGASYTQGLGANPPTAGYAYLIASTPGWRAQVDGVSGTGYLNPGPHGNQTFADRIAHLPTRPHPDLIVFQGGRNDTGYPMPKLRAAIIATVALTRRHFSGAQIVFLGPIPAGVPVPRNQVAVENTLRSAAAACKVTFIDPIAENWITPGNELGYAGHVQGHPDNGGYAYIARRLLSDLNTILARQSQN